MIIDEAKICLSIQVEVKHRLGQDYVANALQLGVEALKYIDLARRSRDVRIIDKLPSETNTE